MENTFSPFVPALTALAAALIAGVIARSNLIVSKETKISEFRQAWIDALREELATFFASTRTMARAMQESRTSLIAIDQDSNQKFYINPEKITDIRHAVADTYYKIQFRLNSSEPDHAKLLKLIDKLTTAQNSYLADVSSNIEDVFKLAQEASDQAAIVLKGEWERVKRGEKEYQKAVRTSSSLLTATGVLLIALIAIVFFGDISTKSKVGIDMPIPTISSKPAIPSK